MSLSRTIDNAVVILASASPRRADLLMQAGIPFRVAPALGVEERVQPEEAPSEAALRLARDKARAGRALYPDADVVIGADTLVVLDGKAIGKPRDPADAERMLAELSGREHEVVTGFAVLGQHREIDGTQHTKVRFRQLETDEISRYVASGEPLDKAGSYGIQGRGALFIEGISGDYTNVMGLPLPRIAAALRDLGWRIA